MKNNQFKYKCFCGSLAIGLMSCLSNTVVAMDCNIATKLSMNIYDRIYNAKNNKDTKVAFAHKDDFWDFYEYSSDCKEVKILANELILNNMSKDDKVPTDDGKRQEILDSCKFGCTITVKGGGKGNVSGIELPEILQLQPFDPNEKIINLKKITDQDLKKITYIDIKKIKLPDRKTISNLEYPR